MRDSVDALAALKRRISQVEGLRQTETSGVIAFGHAEIDARLGGGIERGRLHEIFALESDDASSAAGFAAMVVRRGDRGGSSVIWLRQEDAQVVGGVLHVPGLVELGMGGSDLIVGVLPDPLSLLRVAADVARCAEVGIVVIELWRNPRVLDLTASRRLAVAVQDSGVTALLLRIAGDPAPSAATTRWAVRAVPAVPLEANAPGFPALEVELLRQRGGRAGGKWVMEWNRDKGIFCENEAARTSLSRPVVSAAVGGAFDA